MKKKLITIIIAIATFVQMQAQELSYGEYMERVLTNNIALTAQKLNIEIAAANTKAAKVYNDPTFAITYSSNEDWSKKLGDAIEGELSRTFTFGVRKGGINLAKAEQQETAALLEEYMRNFRADATIAYLEHIKAIQRQQIKEKAERDLGTVADNDSVRYKNGDIAKSDWLESRMAATQAHNARLAADAEVKSTAILLGYYMGDMNNADKIKGCGTLEMNEAVATTDIYIEKALHNRADLQAALIGVDIAEATRKFNAAKRRTDLNIKLAATYNRGAHASEPHDPSFTTIKAGIAIPLKFSNINKGARTADRILVQQAMAKAEDAKLFVESEVMQAYNEYKYACIQAKTFDKQMITDIAEMVNNKKKAYEMGDIPFLDYISVERRKSEIDDMCLETIFNKAVKWVELQRAIGCGLEFSAQPIK